MKKTNKVFIYLLFFIFIVILGVYLGRQVNPSVSEKKPTAGSLSEPETIQNNLAKGAIVYLKSSTQGSDIYLLSLSDKSKKVIFTDKDEELKIKQCASLAGERKTILASLAGKTQEFGGSLWFLSGDGKGSKTKLIDDFASSNAPVTSNDGKKIAYTVFSNVEPDYGFSLIVSDADGSNKQILAKDTGDISNLAFSADNQAIFYSKGLAGAAKGIYQSKVDGAEEKEIYRLPDKEKIYSLTASTDKVAFSKGPLGKNDLNKSEIFTLDNSGKNLQQLTTNGAYEGSLNFSPDARFLAYLSISYEDNSKSTIKSGEIYRLALEEKKTQSLGEEADRIIGWME